MATESGLFVWEAPVTVQVDGKLILQILGALAGDKVRIDTGG